MADRGIYTNEAALAQAEEARAGLALSLLRVFDATIVPDATTTAADMIAVETGLIGYPPGGYPMTAFAAPQLIAAGVAVITSPLVAIVYASGASAALGGAWIEDAAGDVRGVFIFDPPRTLAAIGDGLQFLRQLAYGGSL